jgi:hypothetical protein
MIKIVILYSENDWETNELFKFVKSFNVEHQIRSRIRITLRLRLHQNDTAPVPQKEIMSIHKIKITHVDLMNNTVIRVSITNYRSNI